jgi:serine/threonine protein kinase
MEFDRDDQSYSQHTHADASSMPAGSKVVKPLEQGQKIYDLYSWHEVLQEEGNGGKVVVCRPKHPDLPADIEYVMKIRSRAELREHRLEEQFHRVQERLLCFPPHPGIVRIHEVLFDDAFYYVVMEKAGSEKLFCSLVADHGDGCMPAPSVRRLVAGILDAVRHIHREGMLHRDIKPDNIVMRPANSSRARAGVSRKRPVLIDFDHADPAWSPKRQQDGDVFGTLRFNAPEALLGKFLPQSDLYSIGAILYLLMTGRFPYTEDVYSDGNHAEAWTLTRRKAVHTAMHEARIDFEGPPWPVQPRCRDFCSRLLAFNASDRPISAEHALCHDWFQGQEDSES